MEGLPNFQGLADTSDDPEARKAFHAAIGQMIVGWRSAQKPGQERTPPSGWRREAAEPPAWWRAHSQRVFGEYRDLQQVALAAVGLPRPLAVENLAEFIEEKGPEERPLADSMALCYPKPSPAGSEMTEAFRVVRLGFRVELLVDDLWPDDDSLDWRERRQRREWRRLVHELDSDYQTREDLYHYIFLRASGALRHNPDSFAGLVEGLEAKPRYAGITKAIDSATLPAGNRGTAGRSRPPPGDGRCAAERPRRLHRLPAIASHHLPALQPGPDAALGVGLETDQPEEG